MKRYILPVALMSLLAACTKKTDRVIPAPPSTYNNIPASNSAVSLMNLYPILPTDVEINARKLTSFLSFHYGMGGSTWWFPTGRMQYGALFSVPDSLLDAKGDVALNLYTVMQTKDFLLDSAALNASVTVHSNIDTPKQVIQYPRYLNSNTAQPFAPEVLVVPVTPLAPSRPDNFKIRIINLGAKATASAYDALTLTYADGTPVNNATSGITYKQASDYIELPYGTYQFKIMDANGKPLQDYPGMLMDPEPNVKPQQLKDLSFNNLRTFMPGGVYTLVIAWNWFFTESTQTGRAYAPGIVLTRDNSPSSQPNYIRMQAVNALPGTHNLHFTIDGKDLGGFLNFGAYTDYASFGIGPHKAQVLDDRNKVLGELQFNTLSMQNVTLWAWEKDGQVQLMTSTNDFSLTGVREQLVGGGGGLNQPELPQILDQGFGWHCRFINLSADVPFASFLDQAGDFSTGWVYNYAAAYKQLAPGYLPLVNPYVGYPLTLSAGGVGIPRGELVPRGAVISAYGSDNAGTPGTPLQLLLDHPMIANRALYTNGNDLPGAEPGLYTIVLAGRAHSTDPADKARLLFIKHNK